MASVVVMWGLVLYLSVSERVSQSGLCLRSSRGRGQGGAIGTRKQDISRMEVRDSQTSLSCSQCR